MRDCRKPQHERKADQFKHQASDLLSFTCGEVTINCMVWPIDIDRDVGCNTGNDNIGLFHSCEFWSYTYCEVAHGPRCYLRSISALSRPLYQTKPRYISLSRSDIDDSIAQVSVNLDVNLLSKHKTSANRCRIE